MLATPQLYRSKMCLRVKSENFTHWLSLRVCPRIHPSVLGAWHSTTLKKNQNIPLKKLPFPNRERIFFQSHHFCKGELLNFVFLFFKTSSFHCLDLFGSQLKNKPAACFKMFLAPPAFAGHHLSDLESPQPTWPNGKKKNRLTFCWEKLRILGWAKREKKLVV